MTLLLPTIDADPNEPKPLLRGWSHALAAAGAAAITVFLAARADDDPFRLAAVLIYGLTSVALFTTSAVLHLGRWRGRALAVLLGCDYANIFLVIAGTYTPIGVYLLADWARTVMLAAVWTAALAGIAASQFTLRLCRVARAVIYVAMGLPLVLLAPSLTDRLPPEAIAVLAAGGALYALGAVIYACRRPNPFPRLFGFHEVFHLLVIAGGAAVLAFIWLWVLPAPHV